MAVHYASSRHGAEETARQCGSGAWTVQADLADPTACGSLADAVADRWDGLELLVHNASLFEPVPFEDIALDAWDRMHAVNLRAPFLLTQALLPRLRAARGESALVVHVCDIGAERPVRGYAHYSTSKAGLVMLVKAMAVELAPAIRCVGLSPGHVAWPPDWDEAHRARLARRIPMGRVGEPGDIARLVRFLALEAPYVNGAIVPVDGGLGCRY